MSEAPGARELAEYECRSAGIRCYEAFVCFIIFGLAWLGLGWEMWRSGGLNGGFLVLSLVVAICGIYGAVMFVRWRRLKGVLRNLD